jgi:hypothetical protein
MASLDELVAALAQVNQRIAEAVNATGAADHGAEEAQGQFRVLGAEAQVAAVAQIREGIHQLRQNLTQGIELGNQLIAHTRAAKG